MNKIGVIGIGKLGLSFALLCAKNGFNVYGHDNRADYVKSLLDKTYKTSEPHIEELLIKCKTFNPDCRLFNLVQICDTIFCFVATPSLADGSYDHSAIDSVVDDLVKLQVDLSNKTLVIGCTTMPGYCDIVAKRLKEYNMSVVYNPEFIAQGDIINGLKNADMILIGADKETDTKSIQDIYKGIMLEEPSFNVISRTAAEITKISINCFLATKISYANMIGEVIINSGLEAEVDTILKAIGSDSRIGNKCLKYGFGYGGPCIPRDGKALGNHMKKIGKAPLLPMTIDYINNSHNDYLFHYLCTKNPDKNVPFVFTQLTYKKGIDILTESQQYKLCKDLLKAGYKVDISESPAIVELVQQELIEYKDKITYGYGSLVQGYKIEL